MSAPDHVAFKDDGILCARCNKHEHVFPLRMVPSAGNYLAEILAAFQEDHRDCKETPRSASVLQSQSPADWLRGPDVGMSSETICRLLGNLGPPQRPTWPHDPADFGRCYRLVKMFGWQSRMHEVAAAYPNTPWVPLVREWSKLTALYEEELPRASAPQTYALMCDLRNEIRP